jgi:fumarate reductase subunit D
VKSLVLRLEPLIWFLFGGGFFVGSLFFPVYLFVVALAVPLGFAPAEALTYERAHMLASSLPGRLVLLAMIVFPFWNGANHLRHWLIDLGGYERDGVVAPLCYLAALAVSAIAVVAVLGL